jgi:hypothetical protein
MNVVKNFEMDIHGNGRRQSRYSSNPLGTYKELKFFLPSVITAICLKISR